MGANLPQLLCEPVDPSCAAGVIFFNNVGYLNMCGHGTIGIGFVCVEAGLVQVTEEPDTGNVRVWLDAKLLQSYDLTIDEVMAVAGHEDAGGGKPCQ